MLVKVSFTDITERLYYVINLDRNYTYVILHTDFAMVNKLRYLCMGPYLPYGVYFAQSPKSNANSASLSSCFFCVKANTTKHINITLHWPCLIMH